jgi:hypothetical protein
MAIYYGDGSNSGSGRVIQIVSEYSSGKFSTSSSSYVDVQTLQITPKSSSSKILLQTFHTYDFTDNGRFAFIKYTKNGSDLAIGDSEGPAQRCTVDVSRGTSHNDSVVAFPAMYQYLDTAGGTSQITYKTRIKLTNGGTAMLGRTGNVNDGNRSSSIFQWVAKEIAA